VPAKYCFASRANFQSLFAKPFATLIRSFLTCGYALVEASRAKISFLRTSQLSSSHIFRSAFNMKTHWLWELVLNRHKWCSTYCY